ANAPAPTTYVTCRWFHVVWSNIVAVTARITNVVGSAIFRMMRCPGGVVFEPFQSSTRGPIEPPSASVYESVKSVIEASVAVLDRKKPARGSVPNETLDEYLRCRPLSVPGLPCVPWVPALPWAPCAPALPPAP